jgi:hypothetical protein
VEDSLIEIARGNSGSRASNAGAGLYISGSTLGADISLVAAADGGRLKASGSTAGFDIQTGGDYAINNASVLSATTLGSSVVNSSLTSLGTQAEALVMGSQGITGCGSIAGATSIDGNGDLTMGTITMTGFSVDADGDTSVKTLDVNSGGITDAGAIAGATTISGSGQLSLAVGISAANENFTVSSGGAVVAVGINAGGAISGATTIDASGDLTVGSITNTEFTVDSSGNTDIDGTLNVEGVPTFQAGAVFSAGVTTAGAIAGATTVSGSGQFSMSHIDLDGTLTAGGIVSGSSFLDINHGKLRIGGTAVTANASELNLLDASEGSDIALAAADGVLFADASDSGTNHLMKKATMQNIADLLGAGDGLQVNDSTAAISISYQLQHFSGSTGSAGLYASSSGPTNLQRVGSSYSGLYAPLDEEIVVGSLQVYLNGMLQVKSGSIAGTFDYELLTSGSTANKLVKFAEEPEDDDAIIIQYIKK